MVKLLVNVEEIKFEVVDLAQSVDVDEHSDKCNRFNF